MVPREVKKIPDIAFAKLNMRFVVSLFRYIMSRVSSIALCRLVAHR